MKVRTEDSVIDAIQDYGLPIRAYSQLFGRLSDAADRGSYWELSLA